MIRISFIVLALSLGSVFARGESADISLYREGMTLLKQQGKADQAFSVMEQAALQGHPSAQGAYGFLLAEGWGCERNETAGRLWLSRAAEAGIASARFNLGVMEIHGRGGVRDVEAGLEHLRLSAEQGYRPAMRRLAEVFYFGSAQVEQDYSKALPWVKRVAELQDPWALNVLGTMYQYGQAIAPDRSEAARLYEAAALHGDVRAQNNLANLLYDAPPAEKDLKRAYAWYTLASQELFAAAQRKAALEVALTESDKAEASRLVGKYRGVIEKNLSL